MNKKKLAMSAVVLALIGFGGYLISERIPEVDPDPANAPIADMRMFDAEQMPLTTKVINPAGIAYLADSNTYLVSTDDREIIELSENFSSVISSKTLPASPHAIEDTEGIAYLGDGRAAVVAENGVVILMNRVKKGWKETERFLIPFFESGTLLGSATYDPQTRTLYTAQKTGDKRLYAINIAERKATVVSMQLARALREKQERRWQEFTIAGLQFSQGRLYGISEAYSSLLVFDPDGIVEAAHALRNINESSGITIRDGVFMLIGDAEGYLPDPPVYLVKKSELSE